jgi:type VI secretion system ImpB/VipA family protein
MAVEPSFGKLEIEAPPPEAPQSSTPFRIAVLGNFRGRSPAGEAPGADDIVARRPVPVDAENFDEVLARFQVSLQCPLDSGDAAELSLSSLDDFHPDQIFDKIERFQDLFDAEEQAALMNVVLHQAAFQEVEAAWRGLDWLLRRAQKDSPVEIVPIDLTQQELCADLRAADDLSQTGVHRLLIDKMVLGPKGKPWALLVGLYDFELTADHAEVLGRMSQIARHAAAPFLAAAPARVFDKSFALDEDTAEVWEALRKWRDAAMLGLAAPRFLLRLPYGESTRSIDRFSYEELSPKGSDKVYLWGNPALACAALLAQAFLRKGWGFKPGEVMDLGSMPLHTYIEDDESQATLTEMWLTAAAAQKAAKLGLMTLLPVRGRDSIQLAHFHALAEGAKTLPGRWEKGAGVPRAASGRVPPVVVSINPTSGPAPEAAAAVPPSEKMSPPTETSPTEEPAPASAESAAGMDPELAAMLQQLEGTSASSEAPSTEAAPEMDPELAALLKQVEGSPPAEEAPAASSEAPAESSPEMDPELAALLKQLEESTPAPEEKPAPEMDPELAALLKQLEENKEP